MTFDEFRDITTKRGLYDEAFSTQYMYRIKDDVTYDVQAIALIVKRDNKTVRKWFSEGRLPFVDINPYRTLGINLLRFLYNRQRKVLMKRFRSLFEE